MRESGVLPLSFPWQPPCLDEGSCAADRRGLGAAKGIESGPREVILVDPVKRGIERDAMIFHFAFNESERFA